MGATVVGGFDVGVFIGYLFTHRNVSSRVKKVFCKIFNLMLGQIGETAQFLQGGSKIVGGRP